MADAHIHRIFSLLPQRLRSALEQLPPATLASIEEIRIRVGQPLAIGWAGGRTAFLTSNGIVTDDAGRTLHPQADELAAVIRAITGGSLYAVENEIRQGFITLPGGHRVGLCGEPVIDSGHIRSFAHFQSAAIRIARQIRGAADRLAPYVTDNRTGRPVSILVVSGPQAGKTTLLRDLARRLSSDPPGFKVAIVDERSELASCYQGIPQLDVGLRTDVLDRCPKAEGIMLVVRALSPDIIITDELGRTSDLTAVREALNCGIAVMTSVHGSSAADIARRPSTAPFIAGQLFGLIVELGLSRGRGTIEQIRTGDSLRPLLSAPLPPRTGGDPPCTLASASPAPAS